MGLDVAQDRTTQEALLQTLEAGVLLDCTLDDLRSRQVNAEWLHGLLAPNPTRDLLVWLNGPEAAQSQWGCVRWTVFQGRCKADFGFDPVSDGVLVAEDLLAGARGKWSAVAELYYDSYASFPDVYDLLARVKPPQLGLFDDPGLLAGYPQANEQREAALRYALAACAEMAPEDGRAAILAADKEHGLRRGWLWARMGQSPLVVALGNLAEMATHATQIPAGAHPDQLATAYQQSGWKVDAAALRALAAVHAKADYEPVATALRTVYLPWVEEAAKRLQDAIKSVGGLPRPAASAIPEHTKGGMCTVFVDGLRYDLAVVLQGMLMAMGKSNLGAEWTSMPSVTASGKPWCSPVAHLVAGDASDAEFEPRVAADGKPLSGHNFRKLLTDNGIQVLQKHATGDPTGSAWTEAGDLDHYGHAHGVRLARDADA